jgi:hypothetical protein
VAFTFQFLSIITRTHTLSPIDKQSLVEMTATSQRQTEKIGKKISMEETYKSRALVYALWVCVCVCVFVQINHALLFPGIFLYIFAKRKLNAFHKSNCKDIISYLFFIRSSWIKKSFAYRNVLWYVCQRIQSVAIYSFWVKFNFTF